MLPSWWGTNNNSSTALNNTLTMYTSNQTATVNYAPSCYPLTLAHTGSGIDPSADPSSSSGCMFGQYFYGQSITLSASPSWGSHVTSWLGTNDDSSTSTSNSLTMPGAARTVTVNYGGNCYNLSLTHSGNGNDPTATPANSTGCPAGRYVSGAVVTLSAFPAEYHHVASWWGTNNNSSTALNNTLTFPASDQTATVNYAPNCYPLTLAHTGSGTDPSADPMFSTGCLLHQYIFGELINLRAFPDHDSNVSSWSGTNDNSSTSTSNLLTMPGAARTVTVNYGGNCYNLTLTHSGNGSDPTATPANSTGCPAGRYVSGAVVTLSAFPAEYQHVASWWGTNNNNSTALNNTLFMYTSDQTATVYYAPNCYPLTLAHTGSGLDPSANPSSSPGCMFGQYFYGQSITLSASPFWEFHVASWLGTNDDSSTSTSNSLTMPGVASTVSVNYAPSGSLYDFWIYLPLINVKN